jgi:hypothetical protein
VTFIMTAGGGGGGSRSHQDLGSWFPPPTREQRLDAAWNGLRHAESVSEQTDLVMVLSEMIFGDPPPDPIQARRREIRSWGSKIVRVVQDEA